MKKKQLLVTLLSTGLMMTAMMVGCGNQAQETAPAEPAVEDAATESAQADQAETAQADQAETATEQEAVDDSTEWKVCTEDEAKAACPRLFKAPDDAVVNGWEMKEVKDSVEGVPGPVVALDFRIEGKSFTAYAQYGAGENDNISEMNYDWTVSDDVTLANWGEGNMKGKYSRYVGDGEMIDLCTWYDYEIGIAYALFVEAEDLDGFDLQAIAEQMYDASNEPLTEASK